MASGRPPGGDDLRALAEQKEKEWRDIQQLRTESLESALKQREKESAEERSKFDKLKDDFKFNLKLLHERDAELDKYDSVFGELKATINGKNAELSELHIKIDDLNKLLANETEQKNELQGRYQQRIREKQADVDKYRCEKDKDIQQEREHLELFKRNLERQLREVEEELEIQRKELNSGFEEALRKREHEYRVQADEMNGALLAHEMKAKLLSKELELLKATHEKTGEEFSHIEGHQREIEKQLKQTQWELADTKAMKDARINELEVNLHQMELSMKRMQDEFQRKYAEMDRYSREKESCLQKAKDAHNDRERLLQESVREAQSKLEEKDIEMRRMEWTHADLVKEKDTLIEKLQEEINEVKEKWNAHIADMSRNTVARDMEMQVLKDNDEKQKSELEQRKQDVERYKKELKDSIGREASLERSKAQLDLDWQRRYEDAERGQYMKSEDLVKSLTASRDQALAEVKEKKRELKQREELIRTLNKDRDQAFATLRQHDLVVDRTAEAANDNNAQVEQLKTQNENLRIVIRQMRQEMEQLGQTMPSTGQSDNKGSGDYAKNMESELAHVKAKNRELQLANDRLRFTPVEGTLPDAALKDMGDNVLVRTHVESLNSMVGSLRSEKMELAAQVKKSQARIQHLENLNDQLSKQPRQKQVEIDQLQYELGAQNRRYQQEVGSLRHRVAELELQVTETRKEADEYYKGNLERNMEAVALGNELSNLKVDMAKKYPAINYGAQELVIQQLQDEIGRLRKVVGGDTQFDPNLLRNDPHIIGSGSSTPVDQMKHKLQLAAKHISQLAKEKQQLIQVGNKLRAELTKAGLSVPSQPTRRPPPPPSVTHGGQPSGGEKKSGPLAQKVQNKLNQLEKLQYELTKQELKFAHQGLGKRQLQDVHVESSSSDTPPGVGQPQSILKPPSPPPAPRYNYWTNEVPERPLSTHDQRPSTAGSDYRPGTASTSKDQPLMTSMSSMGGESLQEVWRMLDNPQSPSVITPRNPADQGYVQEISTESDENKPPGSFTVRGVATEAQDRPKQNKQLSKAVLGKVSKKPAGPKPKIRNYNERDDSGRR